MSVWEGLLYLFLKVGLLAVAVMVAVWIVSVAALKLQEIFRSRR